MQIQVRKSLLEPVLPVQLVFCCSDTQVIESDLGRKRFISACWLQASHQGKSEEQLKAAALEVRSRCRGHEGVRFTGFFLSPLSHITQDRKPPDAPRPGPPHPLNTVGWTLRYYPGRKCLADMVTGQFDLGSSSVESLSSQMTLGFIKLTAEHIMTPAFQEITV